MDNRSTLEQEYRILKRLETPDLWSRIEKQLEERPAPVSPGTPTDDLSPLSASPFAPGTLSPKSVLRSPRSRSWLPKILSARGVYKKAAAAAAMILLAVLAPWNRPDLALRPDGMEETTAIAAAETTAGCGDGISYEAQDPGGSNEGDSHEAQGPGGSSDEVSHEGEVSKENPKSALSSPPGDTGSAFLITPISYSQLSLTPYTPMTVPAQAKTMPYDAVHFSEDILKDTELLCQGTVTRARLETDQEGKAVMITYDIALDQVYYSQDYISGADSITVTAPIVPALADSGSESHVLYQLQPGASYLLPLKRQDQNWQLLCASAPQVQVTREGAYLFHSGYATLADDHARVVVKDSEGTNDYYYDRMLLREDDSFLGDFLALTRR